MDLDPDISLVEALQRGDDTALNELMQRHRDALFRFSLRCVGGNEATARDVVQETFVRAYFKVGDFQPRAKVRTWLHIIALNLCRDELRKRGGPRSAAAFRADSEELLANLQESSPSPQQAAAKSEHLELLGQAIAELPDKLREALVLFAIEERSQQEVAELLGTSPKAVETRVYQAKNKLKQFLHGIFPE